MSDKKHIDRLFQEKFQDFEATPSDAVWENINAELHLNKKDRKVIPLWWKLAGIAAGLVLLFAIGNSLLNSNDTVPENTTVDTESNSTLNEDNTTNTTVDNQLVSEDDSIIASENFESSNEKESQNKDTETLNASQEQIINGVNNKTNERVASQTPKSKDVNNKTSIYKAQNQNKESNGVDAVVAQQEQNKSQNFSNDNDVKTTTNPSIDKEKADALLNQTKNEADSKVAVTDSNEGVSNTETESETESKIEENKVSLIEELEKLEEDKEVEDADEKMKRWSVSPNIAPVYFNSLGSGSSIDSKFNNSSKSGDINMSYGVAANYRVNDKLSIRAGVNQVKLGYSTNDVIVYNNVDTDDSGKPLKNVDLNDASQNLSFLSSEGLSFGQVPDVVANNISSSIDQRLGFIEVPIEVEYKLSDKRLNINLIGGFSTLFLNENQVFSTLQNERRLLGEASNINSTSFSANLGVGLNYEVSKKINLNLEPVFKYQLNTFSDTSGNFNPYFIGIYTGLSYKF